MTDVQERVSVTLYLTPNSLPVLREASIRLGLTQNPQGSASAIVQRLVDRLDREENPLGAQTFEESVFNSLLAFAESLQNDCSLCEDEVVEILRKAATRSFDGLQSQAFDDIILDIRAILFS